MVLKVDDMTGVERPRRRRAVAVVVAVVAVVVPIVVLAGAAAWFIRVYIMPPMVTISEPLVASSVKAALARTEPQPAPTPETTGTSLQPTGIPAPAVRYSTNSAEVWASVPLPGPPRQMQSFAAAPTVVVSEPLTSIVPLPPRKPRISNAELDLPAVPLPRPRPFPSN